MIDEATATFLRTGCALIVGTVEADGAPLACRGWGVPHLDAEAGRVDVLLDADDEDVRRTAVEGAPLAITAADVRTLYSVQLKGRCTARREQRADDWDVARHYLDAFMTDVEETDGTPRRLLERLVPTTLWCCTLEVEASFDQTPGPGAGAPLASP